jgi:hypothetical protein
MSRRFSAATLALLVAGGVYLSGGPAAASNMGFKLERDFAAYGPPAQSRTFLGQYYVSFPLFNGLADIANSDTSVIGNPCDLTGRAADMTINADDALCDMWTSRQGQMSMTRFTLSTCQFQSRTLVNDPLFGIVAAGAFTLALQDSGTEIDADAYAINVPFDPTLGTVSNRAVIVGSHDPSYAGQTLALPTCAGPWVPFINLPYHTMYREVDEVLCGLRGVDWNLDVGTGAPDQCDNGIFANPPGAPGDIPGTGSGVQISLFTYDNNPDNNGTDNSFVSRNVIMDPLFGLTFGGRTFDLTPGDGYVVALTPGHSPTLWLSPHF